MEWYKDAFRKYAEFNGRARRTAFWMFFLFNLIASIVLAGVDVVLGMQLLGSLYSLAVIIPSLALGARRLHDTGKSGWWQLLYFLPLIGALVLIFFFVQDSAAEENAYGVSPKAA